MYVCICHAVKESELGTAKGKRAGTGCGSCLRRIDSIREAEGISRMGKVKQVIDKLVDDLNSDLKNLNATSETVRIEVHQVNGALKALEILLSRLEEPEDLADKETSDDKK